MSDFKNDSPNLNRRVFAQLATLGLAVGATGRYALAAQAPTSIGAAFNALRDRPVSIGMLIYPNMDQIDLTGPFEVLARLPNARVHVVGTDARPFKDHLGLTLTPDVDIENAPSIDLLVVTGGPGQEAVMSDHRVLTWIREHVAADKPLFSVCTGALICGAAGVLKGRRATTHWAAFDLLPYFGAIPVRKRVVVDGNIVSAAGVTAGIDGALRVAALLRGDEAAERIQLDIQYAPEPPFNSGDPRSAPPGVLAAVQSSYLPLTQHRLATARAVAINLGVKYK